MKNHIILGLLGVVVIAGLSTQVFNKKAEPEVANQLDSNSLDIVSSKASTMKIDPETGEIMTDPDKIEKLKSTPQNATTEQTDDKDIKNKEMKMTEMENGAIKVDLGKRYVRPNTATIDEHGNLVQHGHSELNQQESK